MSADTSIVVASVRKEMPPYAAYAPPRNTWLGRIPQHWYEKPAKRFISCPVIKGNGQILPFVALENIGSGTGSLLPQFEWQDVIADEYAVFKPGDVVFGKLRPYLRKYLLCDRMGCCPTELLVLRPVRGLCSPRNLYYLVDSASFVALADATSYGVKMPRTSWEKLGSEYLCLPPLLEQAAIVNFLDRQTVKIDALVSKREQLIALSEEKRAALITHAVTEGLNPDAPMIASGIAAVARVPSHWKVRRNRRVFREVDQRSVTGSEELLTVSHITGVTPRSEKEVYMFLADSTEGYKVCRAGDLAINTMWAYMGAVGIAWQEGIVSPSYNVYRPRAGGEYLPRYLDFLYRTPPYICEINRHSKGIWKSRLRLYPDAFFEMCTLTPPLEEQEQILQYIEKQSGLTDAFTGKLRDSIELLREYRTALISAAVTGKIDVRGEVA